MNPMSSQQAREFWTYLHNESERYKQKYFEGGNDYAYKDEMRAAEEIYTWLAREFAGYLGTPVSAASDTQSGLTAEQVTTFLSMLEQKIADGEAWQEQNLRKRQEALAKVSEAEYYRVKLIYKEMQNLAERQTWCYQYTRERLMSILERND